MNIAVVDAGANLKAFARMDGAWLGSIDISIRKARTARFFDMNTGADRRAFAAGRVAVRHRALQRRADHVSRRSADPQRVGHGDRGDRRLGQRGRERPRRGRGGRGGGEVKRSRGGDAEK